MKVLVVEDSKGLAERIKALLANYYLVDIAHTGAEALAYAQAVDYDVVLLDLGLPDINGADVCRTIREQGGTTLVLVISGAGDVKARVKLLDMGADDYITKPFNSDELVARVGALVRRKARYYAGKVIVLDDLQLDVESREVWRSGQRIPLSRKEFDILQYLVRNRGRAISRQMILNHAWETGKDTWNGTVDVHIKNLRDKVDRPFPNHLIKTAYGVGYMVEGTS
ncbi:MAG TPA: response regulator transcription factor [Candidatus Saccharimonadales bacterium]|nr:response regulator transcription factor [Candidatus Saccharimonadales bacterium]